MNRTNFWSTDRIIVRAAEEADAALLSAAGKKPDSLRQWYEDEILFPQSEKEIREGLISA